MAGGSPRPMPTWRACDWRRRTICIPHEAMSALKKIAPKEGVIDIHAKGNAFVFVIDDVTFSTNLIEGNPPPYEDVIPKESRVKVTENTEACRSPTSRTFHRSPNLLGHVFHAK